MQNSWFHQLCLAGPEAAKQPHTLTKHHHVWLLVWCSFNEILCWFYARCNGTRIFQKVKLLTHQYICPQVLGIIKIFFCKCETSLCVLFGQQWLLPRNSPMDAVFTQSFSCCWIMNTDLNWGKWGPQFFRCCSGIFSKFKTLRQVMSLGGHLWNVQAQLLSPWMGKHQILPNCSLCIRFNFIFEITKGIWKQLS